MFFSGASSSGKSFSECLSGAETCFQSFVSDLTLVGALSLLVGIFIVSGRLFFTSRRRQGKSHRLAKGFYHIAAWFVGVITISIWLVINIEDLRSLLRGEAPSSLLWFIWSFFFVLTGAFVALNAATLAFTKEENSSTVEERDW